VTAFDFISVALSFVVGLSITHLLVSAVSVFRLRRHLQLDWMPLAWASSILLFQFQFWWAIYELAGIVRQWTFYGFAGMIALALCLFVAGSLVLPVAERDCERDQLAVFDRDGRWGLAFLATYFAISLWANWYFWDVSAYSYFGALILAQLAIPLIFLGTGNRRAQRALTLVHVVLSAWTVVTISPSTY
jgi:hypothetical protein